ncbi:MAG: UDPGP type 1 family protein [Planctomycetota bacterium]|jgi:UDP-N-acetylglucosamine/UDP-N-acetylgalactosamine diphosphorylase|nr:UDPGP type 1 family protein [Planctomycetota bacterium]
MSKFEQTYRVHQRHGQEHIFADWDELSPEQREELLADCARIDFDWLAQRRKELRDGPTAMPAGMIEPAPVVSLPQTEAERGQWNAARDAGEELLRRGKIAAFLVAGGQGTRLGFQGPKGCFPVGPVSGRTLFQWHAEQILARSRRHGVSIPLYIMTSRENDRGTRAFFEEKSFFGLNPSDVFFFQQEMVPCLDLNGKLLLSSPSTVAMNPNGHGGSLSGLRTSGAIRDMRGRGVEFISYFQVDNPLVTICDPVFIGRHVQSGSEMSCKVLEKNSPSERIGVACVMNGKPAVIEYMDLDEAARQAREADGRLKFRAGSIAIHVLNVDFVDRVAAGGVLPWHQSRKKVPYFTGNRLIKPETENAVKFETFVFDALPQAEKSLNLEVAREQEFAPLKNARGVDSVQSCRELLSRRFRRWLSGAGVPPPVSGRPGSAGAPEPVVEISPLYSLDAGELARKVKPGGFQLERFLLLG